MKNRLLQTPEGVRDIYNEDCERKQILEKNLQSVLRRYGYRPIQTPSFEFFDVFNQEFGSRSSRELYKFFDREGNTLVLRPDITPSVARAAATYFPDFAIPLRLSYTGNTFINNNSYQGRLKERTQLGAEQIGDETVDADAEMIAIAVQLLLSSGLREFQISIGHVDFLKGLFEASGVDPDTQEEMEKLIANRNYYGVEELVSKLNLDERLVKLFEMLKDVQLDREKIHKARELTEDYPRIDGALARLEELDELLSYYDVTRFISYELALVSNLNYYTGMIFAAYTFGSGEAVVNGGRYDHLMDAFGRQAPATGFALIVDQLLAALGRQKIDVTIRRHVKWVVYTKAHREEALKYARDLRMTGEAVELMLAEDKNQLETIEAYASNGNVQELIRFV